MVPRRLTSTLLLNLVPTLSSPPISFLLRCYVSPCPRYPRPQLSSSGVRTGSGKEAGGVELQSRSRAAHARNERACPSFLGVPFTFTLDVSFTSSNPYYNPYYFCSKDTVHLAWPRR